MRWETRCDAGRGRSGCRSRWTWNRLRKGDGKMDDGGFERILGFWSALVLFLLSGLGLLEPFRLDGSHHAGWG